MEYTNRDAEIFGENLYFLRKVHRLSQRELAKTAGISLYCLRKAEHGIFTDTLCIDAIFRISRHFHLRPATLFTPQSKWNISLLLNGEEDI